MDKYRAYKERFNRYAEVHNKQGKVTLKDLRHHNLNQLTMFHPYSSSNLIDLSLLNNFLGGGSILSNTKDRNKVLPIEFYSKK